MTDPFDPRAFARDAEDVARADGWTVRHLSPTASGPRPWFQRAAKSGPGAPALYLSAGIHGDEISGPLALLDLLRRPAFFADVDVTLFPILNPDGLVKDIRHNAGGIDLNRDYRNSKSQEILSHIAALQSLGRFAGAMMLHEDYEGIGAYLYELNDELRPTLGAEIIAAMGAPPRAHRPAPAHRGRARARRRPLAQGPHRQVRPHRGAPGMARGHLPHAPPHPRRLHHRDAQAVPAAPPRRRPNRRRSKSCATPFFRFQRLPILISLKMQAL